MENPTFDFGAMVDAIHAIGWSHVHMLAETASALRERMSYTTTAEDQFAAIHHILAVSQAMFEWTRYLVPEGDNHEELCQACAAEAEEEMDEETN